MTQVSSLNSAAERVLRMEESATLMMARLARQVADEGHKVISLSLGEPDFDTPTHVKEAAKKALDAGYTKYTPVPGIPELREAISRKFLRENGLYYKPSQIVVSNGAKQCIANICLSILNPGDEAILLAPYWVSYRDIVSMAEGVPVVLYSGIEDDFKVSAQQLEGAITEKTRLMIFSSPCNPSGSVYTRDELEQIADVLGRHEQVVVVSDEIYEHINFTEAHVSIGSFDSVKDRTVTVNGFSKAFAMTGWRLGYMGAPQWIADACTKIQGQFTSGANSMSQKAGADALDADMTPTIEMTNAFLKRRNLIIGLLEQIPLFKVNKPMGAFYIFPDVSAYFGKANDGKVIGDSDDFAMYLLGEAHVATVSGAAFGEPRCIRISYAASEDDIREAIRRIGEAVAKLA
jgi:aspartate aminotransferase